MKRYVPIIIGIAALCAVLYVGDMQMKKNDDLMADEQNSDISMKSFQGSVSKWFEGTSTLEYGFDLLETATTTVEKDGALVKVVDGGVPALEVYFSYEGGRGYSPEEYITNVIVPRVSAISDMGTTTIGSYDWSVVESQWSEWHVARAQEGNWLIVVENRKANHDAVSSVIESISAK